MFGLFKTDPLQKLEQAYETKLQEAMKAQRNGDIRKYSELSEEAELLLNKINNSEKK